MPLHVLAGGPAAAAALPPGLLRVKAQQLQPPPPPPRGGEHRRRGFQGTITIAYPLTVLGNGTSLFKMVLEDFGGSSSRTGNVTVLLFGKLAVDCSRVAQQGDTVVVAGFNVAKCTREDNGHCCQLEVSEEAGSTVYIFTKVAHTTPVLGTAAMHVVPKYTYTPLNHLKDGTIVNFYGAVKFFKPPYVSKGTDYCSVVTVVDQSEAKLVCMLFNASIDALPKIYKIGDIVRFHRIKVREFGGQMQGITSNGFAALIFDSTIGTPVVPRTSCKSFTFTDEDKKMIEDLRVWVARNFSNCASAAKLSAIQPLMFFDLTCQLLGKAKVDGSSYLLKVWDGTKCAFPSWKTFVKEEDLEGDGNLIQQLKNLSVDVVVYDNHVQFAKSLKVGSIIRMYSLHAKLHSPNDQPDVSFIQFHLHGGTVYGRGVTVLPESHADAKELKAFLASVDVSEYDSQGSSSSPESESTYFTFLTEHQHFDVTALSTVLNSRIPQHYRIRAKLKRFEPAKLHQSVKLHCPQCKSLQEIPDGAKLDLMLRKASAKPPNPNLQRISFCESVVWDAENLEQRCVTVHFVKHGEGLEQSECSLIMMEGGTLPEILRLSKKFKGIIPVTSTKDNLVLLSLSTPFYWQGNMQHYGCKRCSKPKAVTSLSSLSAQEHPSWEPGEVAQALGVVHLQYVFVMRFTLDDGTGELDAYLIDRQTFFQVAASEVLTSNILQEKIERAMQKLRPAETGLGDLPWLECFIKSYYVRDGTERRLCYQIVDTVIAEDVC